MLNEKDTDTRPLLDRIEAALSGSQDVTLTREGDRLTAAFAGTKLTFRNADAVKGVVAMCEGLEPAVERKLLAVKGVAVRRVGTEVSWRALEQVCAVIAASATPKARKARAAATERKASADALKATAAAEAEQRARDAAIPVIEKLADLLHREPGVRFFGGYLTLGGVVTVHQCGDRRNTLRIGFSYAADAVATVKAIQGARFDGDRKDWTVPGAEYPELARLLPLLVRHVAAAAEAKARERAAARISAGPAEAPLRKPGKPRMLVLRAERPAIGEKVRSGDAVMVVEDFGKEFRVNEDMPSMYGSWLLGHEGERCMYAYLRDATPEDAAAFEAREAADRAEAQAARERARAVRAVVDDVRTEGGYVPPQETPKGAYVLRSTSEQRLYGYGTDLLQAEDGALWLIEHRGADGDSWEHNNLPGAIGHRLPPGPRADALVEEILSAGVESEADS